MTLTEFLLARIAEDGAVIATDSRDRDAFGPTRMAAECEAKREIIEWHGEHLETAVHGRPCRTLRSLALPYADHPDYRQEWKP